jgi:16S rRNA (guanine1207-N2)-methyltransferase
MEPGDLAHWYKKDVTLDWGGQHLTFAVSQSLFSSHAVDAGSRLLLRSLDPDALPATGHAVDFGCGYGVLGLALKAARPRWRVELIDRDALAVAFSAWNARRLGWEGDGEVVVRHGLGLETASEHGIDLLLWNVPGKAGQPVIQALLHDAISALASGGLLAMVIVNPLANMVRQVVDAVPDCAVEFDRASSAHTVLHVRRRGGRARLPGSPFERGVFDRPDAAFHWRDTRYALTPVIGLPEYDSRDHATDCVLEALAEIGSPLRNLVVHGAGQGHVAVLGYLAFGVEHLELIDRDVLALAATRRAVMGAGMAAGAVTVHARVDLGADRDLPEGSVVVVMLPDQQTPAVTAALIRDLSASGVGPVELVVGGGSTSITRLLGAARHERGWRPGARRRRHGASAVRIAVDRHR